jgi:hypothetical protein
MATLTNARNVELAATTPRTTIISSFITATDSAFSKTSTGATPASLTLTTNTTGPSTPTYLWEYALSTSPNTWVALGVTTAAIVITSASFTGIIGTAVSATYRCTVSAATFITAQPIYIVYFLQDGLLASDILAAKNAADAANLSISSISSDNILHRSEKPELIKQWDRIGGEKTPLRAQAVTMTLDVTSLDATYLDVQNYLNGLLTVGGAVVSWTDLTTDHALVGVTLRAKFLAYTNAAETLRRAIAAKAATIADWVGVGGRPKSYRVGAAGLSANAAGNAPVLGLQDADTGTTLVSYGFMYRVAKINRVTKAVTELGAYNLLGEGLVACNAMAAALNGIDSAHICVVFTFDEPQGQRMQGNLPAAMYRNGASRAVYASPAFQHRGAYILVGIGGCGEGNGAENYAGAASSDPNAWCDTSFQISALGALIVSGASRGATTLLDLDYVGERDATKGATIGVNVGGSFTPSTWDAAANDNELIKLVHIDRGTITNLASLNSWTGTLQVSTDGHIRGGQTAYNTGSGFFLGDEGGFKKFSVGSPTGSHINFDQSTGNISLAMRSLDMTFIGTVKDLGLIVASHGGVSPGTVSAIIRFSADGLILIYSDGAWSVYGSWYAPQTSNIGGSFWIRMTKTTESSTPVGPAANVWHSLSTDRDWYLVSTTGNASANMSKYASLTFSLATGSGGSPVVSTGTAIINTEMTGNG